jgi:cyclopropane fatty-acyl-phospholipid synthase-like methyltransferase
MATYSQADGPIWRHAVYNVLHGGWDMACIGGREFLNDLAARAAVTADSRVLELGCGSGAGCHYLVERTGCRATGVELNPEQIERARRRGSAMRERKLSFIQGDVAALALREQFDVVFQLDTFSLLPDISSALRAAHRAVTPEGALYMADLVAGPHMDAATYEHAWLIDGFSSLLSMPDLESALQIAGFAATELKDHTDDAVRANAKMLAWLENPPTPLPQGITEGALADWREVTQWYCERFEDRALGYYWLAARPQS